MTIQIPTHHHVLLKWSWHPLSHCSAWYKAINFPQFPLLISISLLGTIDKPIPVHICCDIVILINIGDKNMLLFAIQKPINYPIIFDAAICLSQLMYRRKMIVLGKSEFIYRNQPMSERSRVLVTISFYNGKLFTQI